MEAEDVRKVWKVRARAVTTQWIKALVALVENQGSIPATLVRHSHPKPSSWGI